MAFTLPVCCRWPGRQYLAFEQGLRYEEQQHRARDEALEKKGQDAGQRG